MISKIENKKNTYVFMCTARGCIFFNVATKKYSPTIALTAPSIKVARKRFKKFVAKGGLKIINKETLTDNILKEPT